MDRSADACKKMPKDTHGRSLHISHEQSHCTGYRNQDSDKFKFKVNEHSKIFLSFLFLVIDMSFEIFANLTSPLIGSMMLDSAALNKSLCRYFCSVFFGFMLDNLHSLGFKCSKLLISLHIFKTISNRKNRKLLFK